MFEKSKARMVKLEEDHENVRNTMKHLRTHKVVYASIGSSVITLVVVKTTMKPTVIQQIIQQAPPVVAPVFNNMPVFNNENIVNNGGHATKIIQRASDGKIWEKVGDAAWEYAEKLEIPLERARNSLSQNINGHKPDAFGDTFRAIGLGTTG